MALARIEARFAQHRPEWHGNLFDHFLKTAAAPLWPVH
jgi:hypothetical protein